MTGLAALFRPRRSGAWQALLLLLALALGGQSVAVQAHHHDPVRTCVTAPTCKAPARPHKADNCALCQEARVAGHYLPIDALAVALAPAAGVLPGAVAVTRAAAISAPLPWRSRAPPALPV